MKLGFVVNGLDEEYQISIYRGAKKRAAEVGVTLFCLQQENSISLKGTFISGSNNDNYLQLDGVIFLTSVMPDCDTFISKKDVQNVWGDIPVISLGQQIVDVPSILVETDYSMKQLVEHLIIEHKYKRFIFLGGPDNHKDAIQRKEIFLRTIEAYKPWYPEITYLIEDGQFTEGSALMMMSDIYEEYPEFNPDVVICSTDNMAIAVYKYFKMNRDVKNIKECAVTGFDDIPQARFEIPPITTVHQPLEEMGAKAVDEMLKICNGEKVKELDFIESNLIIRESCGCRIMDKPKNYEQSLLSDLQSEYIFSEQMLRFNTQFEQKLNYCETRNLLRYYVDSSLESIDLKSFCVLLSTINDKNQIMVEPFYVKRNGVKIDPFNNYKPLLFSDFLEQFMDYDKDKSKSLITKYMVSGNQVFGCVLYESEIEKNPYISSMIVSIGQAIIRITNLEEKKRYSEFLEEEVNNRTKELVEANNRRMEVEAEVLKISELERQRFSNDLHDDICQRLAGISMLCRSYSNQTKAIERNQMVELAELISETLQTTRQYAHNSYPVELESLGLNYAISNLCNSFEKQTGIICEYVWGIDDDVNFSSLQKLNIFRIIQEALHNTMKHAKASKVWVDIQTEKDKVNICIKDNGCGFSKKEQDKNQGIGINSMKYRANQIGAEFEILDNKPNGTVVHICINMTDENENER